MEIIILSLAVIALLIGSFVDLKKREVPDTISYGAIILGFLIHLSYAGYYWNLNYLLQWLLGFGIFFAIGYSMFYLGQWGGGDSKLLMGLGSLIGMSFSIDDFLIGFFFNTLIISVAYNLAWIIIYYIRDRKKINALLLEKINSFGALFKTAPFLIVILMLIMILLPLDIINKSLFLLLLSLPLVYYLHFIIEAVEKTSMRKLININDLTEGDWIVEDVVVDKQYICGPKDLGISLEQISQLKKLEKQKKMNKILVKYGIPFVPCFLISFLTTLWLGNIWFKLLF